MRFHSEFNYIYDVLKKINFKMIDINNTLIEGYLQMLENLSANNKLDLISKLSLTIKGNDKVNNKTFYEAFGAWDSSQSAEDIIKEIRKSRILKRKIEKF